MSDWDADPQVLSPVGRPIEELLEPRVRQQTLAGFDPVYSDIVDYILRCTHRIWEEKNVGLCATHYAPDCRVHTLAGPTMGVGAVIANTVAALSAFPDRRLLGEDVIWSEDAPGLFHTSHRIVSDATHMGTDGLLGAPTLMQSGVTTIADCLCRENRIVEEWLVRDNAASLQAIGRDPWAIARAQADADRAGPQDRHAWRAAWIADVRAAAPAMPPADHPAAAPAGALRAALADAMFGDAAQALSPAAEIRWPSGRHAWGRGAWIACLVQLRAAMGEPAFSLDHWAARPLPGGDVAVALRWTLAGVHAGDGVWGAATGRDLLVLAVSHYRLRAGRIVEDATVFDELAVARQVAGGLGA